MSRPVVAGRCAVRVEQFVVIRVNGEELEIPDASSVADLLTALKYDRRYVAVERNRILVPRGIQEGCSLAPGDELEIVTLTGGG